MRYSLLFLLTLLFCASGLSQPSRQSTCKYWLSYFGKISKYEKEKLQAIRRGDIDSAKYYAELIRRDIADVNDDTEEEQD